MWNQLLHFFFLDTITSKKDVFIEKYKFQPYKHHTKYSFHHFNSYWFLKYSVTRLWIILLLQVVIEGLMQTLRSILLASFVFTWPSESVLLYGVSHLCGSFVYAASYYILFAFVMHKKSGVEKLPIHSFWQLFPTWGRRKWMVSLKKGKQWMNLSCNAS